MFDTETTSATAAGDIYSVSLTNWIQLYLVPVRVEEKQEESGGWASTYQDGMEMYLATTEGQKSLICCSYRGMREEIVRKLNELYDIVKTRDGQGALAPEAAEVLTKYLDGELTNKFTAVEEDELPFYTTLLPCGAGTAARKQQMQRPASKVLWFPKTGS